MVTSSVVRPTNQDMATGYSEGEGWARSSEFEDLFRAEFGPLATFATLVCGRADLGEELAQDAFARLAFRRGRLPDIPKAYLRATVVNCWRSVLRRARAEASMRLRRVLIQRTTELEVKDLDIQGNCSGCL